MNGYRPISALVVSLPLLCACSAYDTRYEFEPRPVEVGHTVSGAEDRAASVLVTAEGVRKRDAKHDIPASVELRLRVDNNWNEEIRLEASAVQLFAANLANFPEPIGPDAPLVVLPHGSGTLTLYFPFPDGNIPGAYDLEGMSARWMLLIGGRESTGNATFTRRSRDHAPVGFGFGFGLGFTHFDSIHHRRRGTRQASSYHHRHPATPGH